MSMMTKAGLILPAAAVLLLSACSGGTSTDSAESAGSGNNTDGKSVSAGCPDPDGALAQRAKEEGEVVMTGTPDGSVRTDIPKAFEQTYGVKVTYVGGRNSDIAAKLQAERKAGIYTHDVFGGGGNTMSSTYYGEGWISSLKDVLDPALLTADNWRDGAPKWVDPEKEKILQLSNYVDSGVVVNTDLVKDGDLTSFEDMLDPKWKGKIVVDDPRSNGGAIYDVGAFEQAYGKDFVKSLYVDQKPVLLTDQRQELDDIARGKFAFGLSLQTAETEEALAEGLPLKQLKLTGAPPVVTGGSSLLALDNKAPHPEAAKLLVNWLVCKDGNTVWTKALQVPSNRADVPVPAELGATVPQAGSEYYDSYGWTVLTKDVKRLQKMLTELLGPQ
ncbi:MULTISPECIES: extracellular solute-binding protein [unclassified Streptomyces]|uniref:ABC transporter substrate-binding protein n=1 Tax=unclassified Streptomyces TaxID=2593676 RepID=UPI00137161BE|nr:MULTISPECIES: extracellular solute-binding protein [unclassified Streptomyces]MYZ40719.1 extracellular solute-binding protein [Streptomyces sp. SID4917]